MKKVVVYGSVKDPYFARTVSLLNAKKIAFEHRSLPEKQAEMKELTGFDTGPQIMIDNKPIGSFETLGSLELKGELDKLLE